MGSEAHTCAHACARLTRNVEESQLCTCCALLRPQLADGVVHVRVDPPGGVAQHIERIQHLAQRQEGRSQAHHITACWLLDLLVYSLMKSLTDALHAPCCCKLPAWERLRSLCLNPEPCPPTHTLS